MKSFDNDRFTALLRRCSAMLKTRGLVEGLDPHENALERDLDVALSEAHAAPVDQETWENTEPANYGHGEQQSSPSEEKLVNAMALALLNDDRTSRGLSPVASVENIESPEAYQRSARVLLPIISEHEADLLKILGYRHGAYVLAFDDAGNLSMQEKSK
jgi:hypothetical protein